MADPDLFIRHVPSDSDRAELVARTLQRFGYATNLITAPPPPSQPVLVLWSSAALNDDALIWECRRAAHVDPSGPPAPIYEALIAPAAGRVSIHPSFGRYIEGRRLQRVDLSAWDGAPDSDLLTPLLWEIPPPAAPAPTPPVARPDSRGAAQWRALRAAGDVVAMARHLHFRISRASSREDAAKVRAELDEIRAAGADPAAWTHCGPRTVAAAAAGPEALRARADEVATTYTMLDPEAPDGMRRISAVADLLFAIQICAGFNKRNAFSFDLRTQEEMIQLIEAGDSDAIHGIRYDADILARVTPILERLAKANNPAALAAVADFRTTPDYRRRLMREKAAQLGDIPALHVLVRDLEYRKKFRETIPLLRRGAELGDRSCKEELARALDAGKHVPRDPKEAFAIYQEIVGGIDSLDTQIALRIAQMRWDGDGCPRDRDAAVRSFFGLHIGDQAPFAVVVHIGDLYLDGLGGLAKDRDEAISWYRGATTFGGVEGAVARRRLKELGAKGEPGETQDDELDEEERERFHTFWHPRP